MLRPLPGALDPRSYPVTQATGRVALQATRHRGKDPEGVTWNPGLDLEHTSAPILLTRIPWRGARWSVKTLSIAEASGIVNPHYPRETAGYSRPMQRTSEFF